MQAQHRPRSKNLGSISNDRAKALLRTYLSHGYRLRALYPALDDHEFRAAVEDAILDAALSYDAERGAKESTWVAKMIRWRLDEVVLAQQQARSAEALADDAPSPVDPEQAFIQAMAMQAVNQLDPRAQAIIAARMEGETFQEAGDSLSISKVTTFRVTRKAFAVLRSHLEGTAA